jgi:hypothetical protein
MVGDILIQKVEILRSKRNAQWTSQNSHQCFQLCLRQLERMGNFRLIRHAEGPLEVVSVFIYLQLHLPSPKGTYLGKLSTCYHGFSSISNFTFTLLSLYFHFTFPTI